MYPFLAILCTLAVVAAFLELRRIRIAMCERNVRSLNRWEENSNAMKASTPSLLSRGCRTTSRAFERIAAVTRSAVVVVVRNTARFAVWGGAMVAFVYVLRFTFEPGFAEKVVHYLGVSIR